MSGFNAEMLDDEVKDAELYSLWREYGTTKLVVRVKEFADSAIADLEEVIAKNEAELKVFRDGGS